MNEVRAAKERDSQLNGQQYLNLCTYLRDRYEGGMSRQTNIIIRISDVLIGKMIMDIERYIRQCDEESNAK